MGITSNINDAKTLIENIKNNTNLFMPTTVVFYNTNSIKWFKSYWLKNEDNILMNVNLITISDFIKLLVDDDKRIIEKDDYKLLLLKNIINKTINYSQITNYITNKNNEILPLNLYDIVNTLSSLFIEYDNNNVVTSGFQQEIYDMLKSNFIEYNLITKKDLINLSFNKKINNLHFFDYSKYDDIDKTIINKYLSFNDAYVYDKDVYNNTPKLTIIKAPSCVREIEGVHSKICEIIKNDDKVKFSDFLIVSNNLEDYTYAIEKVFNNNDKNYIDIPYSFKTLSTNYIDTLNLFALLKEMINNKGYSRKDIYNLLNNNIIRNIKELSLEDCDTINNVIINLNAYQSNINNDDFNYVRKRLLLDKLVENKNNTLVKLNDGLYFSYSNSVMSDDLKIKFISILDDLDKLIKDFSNITIDDVILNNIESDLKAFFMKDNNCYNYSSKQIFDAINKWTYYNLESLSIKMDVFISYLTDSLTKMYRSQEAFSSGVTFIPFDKISYNCDYVFFLGANSNVLPSIDIKSELDLSVDKNKVLEEENNFYEQFSKTNKHFYISYLTTDLKNDEELYPSAFISKLEAKYKITDDTIDIKLDETRPWSKLFTKKEMIEKSYFNSLSNKEEKEKNKDLDESFTKPQKIKFSDIVSFFEDPLIYKYNSVLGKINSLYNESLIENNPVKPSDLDEIFAFNIIIERMYEKYLADKDNYDFNDFDKQALINELYLKRKYPTCDKKHVFFDEIYEKAYQYFDSVSKYDSFKIISNLKTKITNNSFTWEIDEANILFVEYKENDSLCYSYVAFRDSVKNSIRNYIFGLMNIVNLNTSDYITLNNNNQLKINSNMAIEILNNIYDEMNNYEDIQSIYTGLNNENDISSLDEYINKLYEDNGYYCYFNLKDILVPEVDLGYKEDNFTEEYKENRLKLMSLLGNGGEDNE